VVATRAQHEQVRLYLAGVDKPARQVRIEARFVETGHDPRFVIGLDPTNLQPNLSLGELAAQWNLNDLGAARLPTEAVFSAETLSLQLRALKSDDSSRVINQPSVTTSENREVYLSVGTEEPFASASLTATGAGDALAGATQTAVAFRRIGTSINVVPTVFETTDGRLAVRLAVQVEVGSLAGFRRVGDSDVPRVQSQRYLFTVVVPDGQTLAFGGLSGAGEQSGERALPLLGDLPLAGALFRSRSRSSSQRNLVAYITPRVLTGGELAKEPPSVSADDLSEAVRITDRPGRLLQPPAVETDSGGRG
jgi:type II secretory pathway component GspD/PulD (secretin)